MNLLQVVVYPSRECVQNVTMKEEKETDLSYFLYRDFRQAELG